MRALENDQTAPPPVLRWQTTEPGSAVAVGWWPRAIVARFAAPHLRGPDWWRGVQFAVLPAMVSLVVVLPLLGAGLLGLRLGAGPFPLLGNLLLHALYGATLGP